MPSPREPSTQARAGVTTGEESPVGRRGFEGGLNKGIKFCGGDAFGVRWVTERRGMGALQLKVLGSVDPRSAALLAWKRWEHLPIKSESRSQGR